MIVKDLLKPMTAVSAAVWLFAACGHQNSGLNAEDRVAFDQAPPDLKQAWTQAIQADKANDYVTAQTLLWSIERQELSAAQKRAVSSQERVLSQRLFTAVEKGDPAATKALEELRRAAPGHRR
jgi:hypothetical protein